MYFVDKRFTNSIHNEGMSFEKYKRTAIIWSESQFGRIVSSRDSIDFLYLG